MKESTTENNSNEVVEIDLKDLMFAVLHKWRPVLAVAVIMAVLLGGAKGAMTYRKQNDPETAKEVRVTYQNDLELYEKNKSTYEREMENLRTDIANQQEYLDHSIWINMSPYDVCEARERICLFPQDIRSCREWSIRTVIIQIRSFRHISLF